MRHATTMVLLGLGLGVLGAFGATRVMTRLLFQVSTLDPLAFMVAALAMAVVGLLAALVPASRASRVDPVTALRSEG